MTKIKDKYLANIVGNWLKDGSLADLSGNGNDAALNAGSTYWENTKRGRVPKLNGTDTEIQVPYNAVFDTSGFDFSISFWCYQEENDATIRTLVGRLSVNEGWWFYTSSGNISVRIGDGGGTATATGTSVLSAKNWVFVTLTYARATADFNLYVDGIFVATANNTYDDYANAKIGLGVENDGGSQWLNGSVQDVIVWKGVEFTGAEASQLYEEGLQEAHYDRVDIKQLSDPARNLMPDGDMEAVGVADYVVFNNASLAKETDTPHSGSQYLKVSYNGTAGPGARVNDTVEVGKTYRFRGWAKSDGTWTPQINDFTTTLWTGTLSTDWQYFDFVKTWDNSAKDFLLYHSGQTSGYTAWDDITVQEIPNSDPVYIADGKGWNESVGNVTSNFLENTGWDIESGTWQVDDTGNGDGTKQITCVSAGIVSIPMQQAYGTWEFDVYKTADAGSAVFVLMSDIVGTLGTDTNSYYFNFASTEKFELYRDTSGTTLLQQSSGTFSLNTWYRIKMTRNGSTWVMYHSTDGGQTYTQTPLGYAVADAAPHTDSSVSFAWSTAAGGKYRDFKFSPIIQ
jgi:hypothetical protein